MSLSNGRRRVLVVAQKPSVRLEDVIGRAQRDASELIILCLGMTPSPAQKMLVRRALEMAVEQQVVVEAKLVRDTKHAREFTEHAREITIAARESEQEELEAAFLPAHPGLPGVAQWNGGPVGRTGSPISPEVRVSPGTESVESLAGRQIPRARAKTFWTAPLAAERKQADLRIYLGAAPGVGKTYSMLGEGQRRRSRGADVVVAFVETYERPLTAEMLTGLEVIPRRRLRYRECEYEEMDVDAVIDRKPAVVLVDELAHTNVPGARRVKRWEDVLDLLAAGLEVITTVNIQHLESLNDVIASITGIRQQETVPDWVVDLADQVELVDMSPEALRRRMRHGNVYPDPAKSDLALRRFFTMENLTALRELALMKVARGVDADLLERWTKPSIPETRERILVCVAGRQASEDLVRRGARMANRLQGDFFVLHVNNDEPFSEREVHALEGLSRDLGGEFHQIDADSIIGGILDFAYSHHVTQIVLGEPARPRWQEIVRGSIVNQLIREASEIDVHVIARRQRPSGETAAG